MRDKIIKHGNHIIGNDTDGYIYTFNTSNGYTFNSHLHKCYEFIHVIKGHFLYTVEGTDYIMSDGDFIMTTPDELHSFSFPKECDYHREFIHVYPGFVKDYPEIIKTFNKRKIGHFNRINAELVKKYGIDKVFDGMREYCENPIAETDFMVLTYTLQLFTKINQVMRNETPEKQIVTNKQTTSIRAYIDVHYKENISVDSIAEAMFLSPAYASRLFKKETGMTIKSYLNLRRVTHAKSLIMQGRKATNIFPECGFCDYSTFYRAFIKYVGMTPDEFKHMHNTKIK